MAGYPRSSLTRPFTAEVRDVTLDATALAGCGHPGMVADAGEVAAIERFMDAALAHHDGLDVLVNNAGIAGPTAACEDVALADWERTLAVNLTGQFLCAQRAIPLLKKSTNASMANLSSAAPNDTFSRIFWSM